MRALRMRTTLQPCDRALRLSSQVISDTINALPVKPTAVSHALGPYLHVQQVGFCMYEAWWYGLLLYLLFLKKYLFFGGHRGAVRWPDASI